MTLALLVFIAIPTLGLVYMASKWRKAARIEFIRRYAFPIGLYAKLEAQHPGLTRKDCDLVAHALRHYFLAHLKSGCKFVAMPSQVADDLWHEFILHTKNYALFCQRAFGQFMHHTPASALSSSQENNTGLRRCWWYVCLEENINPRKPTRLPLLFALDAKLNIKNGFSYAADCSGLKENRNAGDSGVVYCGGDFSNSSFDGGTSGLGDSSAFDGWGGDSSGSGDSGGCGGGCGGGD